MPRATMQFPDTYEGEASGSQLINREEVITTDELRFITQRYKEIAGYSVAALRD